MIGAASGASLALFRVVDALLFWPERALDGRMSLDDPALERDLLVRLRARNPMAPGEDLEWALADFRSRQRAIGDESYAGWWSLWRQTAGLGLQALKGGARAGRVNWRSWLAVSSGIDMQSLLLHDLVARGAQEDLLDWYDFESAQRLRDADIDDLLRKQVWDVHVHLGGVRSGAQLWLDLLLGRNSLAQFPHLERQFDPGAQCLVQAMLTGGDADVARRSVSDAGLVVRAMLSSAWGPNELDRRQDFRRERSAIFRLLKSARATSDWQILDRYLNAKSAFLSAVTQPASAAPGLARFRDYFSAGQRSVATWGVRQLKALLHEALETYQDKPHIRGVEFRIGPADAKQTYYQLTRLAAEQAGRQGPRIQWCIHFQRSLDGYRNILRRDPDRAAETLRLHVSRTASLAATLQSFRLHQQRLPGADMGPLADMRIDVAGQERDGWFDCMAFVLRLLRGDRRARDELATADPALYRHWIDLSRSSGGIAWETLPQMRATCHAGEDFAHVAEGLESIAFACSVFDMGGGDSIGHGLALGALAEAPAASSEIAYCPVVRQFDVLVWLHSRATSANAPPSHAELRLIETALDEFYRGLDGSVRRPPTEYFYELEALRAGPVGSHANATDPVKAFFALRHCPVRHVDLARPAPLHSVFRQIPQTLAAARAAVATMLEKCGVVVEINPSSNLRVSGAGARLFEPAQAVLRHWPVLRMIDAYADRIPFAIATDDPGVFGTDLETEYVLLLQGLGELDWPRQRILRFLDECRRNSVRLGDTRD